MSNAEWHVLYEHNKKWQESSCVSIKFSWLLAVTVLNVVSVFWRLQHSIGDNPSQTQGSKTQPEIRKTQIEYK